MKSWTWIALAGGVLMLGAGLVFMGAAAALLMTAVAARHDTGAAVPSVLLEREPMAQAAPEPEPEPASTGVYVNRRALTSREVRQLTAQYGRAPEPGRYWYDAASGLYGRAGEPPSGLLRAGHSFGRLHEDASAGGTHVTLNGRRLPAAEVAYYESRVGRIRPGRYWADGSGNVGLEGLSTPLIRGGAAWNGQWSGAMTSGTVDRSGGGNSVFSVDGEVLTLP